ncbi:MAG: hypothetical protein LJE94_08460 [Deltaproteobacteria bacterium]|nr:hypothetical protein [Deltaproteobacteria bacterium]
MNDFLHSLRSNKDKRFDRNRRNYDSPGYRPNDRMNTVDRKRKGTYRSQQNEQTQAYAAINKLLPTIKSLLESLTEDRKKLIEAEERKAEAMETIASFLKQLAGSTGSDVPALESIESICEGDRCEAAPEEAAREQAVGIREPSDPSRLSEGENAAVATTEGAEGNQRDDLVSMIKGLRNQGFSYEKIARHLEENNIPTISGRGRWRGQAVSKLCQ